LDDKILDGASDFGPGQVFGNKGFSYGFTVKPEAYFQIFLVFFRISGRFNPFKTQIERLLDKTGQCALFPAGLNTQGGVSQVQGKPAGVIGQPVVNFFAI
jgi:hypothetical protein